MCGHVCQQSGVPACHQSGVPGCQDPNRGDGSRPALISPSSLVCCPTGTVTALQGPVQTPLTITGSWHCWEEANPVFQVKRRHGGVLYRIIRTLGIQARICYCLFPRGSAHQSRASLAFSDVSHREQPVCTTLNPGMRSSHEPCSVSVSLLSSQHLHNCSAFLNTLAA